MNKNKDKYILKLLNKELKKNHVHVKVDFHYYDSCPFKKTNTEIGKIILKYVDMLEDYHNRIFVLSSLCDEHFKECVPYLLKVYHDFINNVYKDPIDEEFLNWICNTLAKIKSFNEYTSLYKEFLCSSLTESAEPIIEGLAENCFDEFEENILGLVKKENMIPQAWLGKLSEDSKYWCSFVALKCIVRKNDIKYLSFFQELLEDKDMVWLSFTESKYQKILTIEWKNKYKKLAEKGINKLKRKN